MHRSPGTGHWGQVGTGHRALGNVCRGSSGVPECPGDKGILKGDLEGVFPGQSDAAGGQTRGIPAGEERE